MKRKRGRGKVVLGPNDRSRPEQCVVSRNASTQRATQSLLSWIGTVPRKLGRGTKREKDFKSVGPPPPRLLPLKRAFQIFPRGGGEGEGRGREGELWIRGRIKSNRKMETNGEKNNKEGGRGRCGGNLTLFMRSRQVWIQVWENCLELIMDNDKEME